MDPFGERPVELVTIDARGRKSRRKSLGLRLEVARGAGLHVGLHAGRIHVMARGAITRRHRSNGKVIELTEGLLQLVVVPEPAGLVFELRPEGKLGRRLFSGSTRVLVLDEDGHSRRVNERMFMFEPVPKAEVRIDVSGTRERPTVVLNLANQVAPSPSGRWQTRVEMLLHTSSNSIQVLFREMRVVALPE